MSKYEARLVEQHERSGQMGQQQQEQERIGMTTVIGGQNNIGWSNGYQQQGYGGQVTYGYGGGLTQQIP